MQKHIFFDLDSTLAQIEGLDHLAEGRGVLANLEEITRQAMNGELPMREALIAKIEAIRPNRTDLIRLAQIYLGNLTMGAEATLQALAAGGYTIWLITGNFHPAAGIVAKHLGIHKDRVLANTLQFDQSGAYQAFDHEQPLANNGGKALLIRRHTGKDDLVFMIGDGATDLETQGTVDLFIGFGGVVRRDRVAKNAEVFVEDANLQAVLPYILNYQPRKSIKIRYNKEVL